MKTNKRYFERHAHGTVGECSHGDIHPPAIFGPWHSTLKFTNANNASMKIASIKGGQEDALRIEDGSFNLKITAQELWSGGKGLITITDASENITITGRITQRGEKIEVEIDPYSPETHKPSTHVFLNLTTSDGSPVRYKSWLGCKPTICNPEQKYERVFFLSENVGAVWRQTHRLLKFLRILK